MRRAARAVWAPAVCAGLLVSGCGGGPRAAPFAGGYAQRSPAVPEPSAAEAPASPVPSVSSGPAEAPGSPTGAASPSAGPLEIRARVTRYGRILVDGEGRTIYVADRDKADFESTCGGACAKDWPPLYTNGQVTAGPRVNSAWLGTIGREDGPTQVEYNGWPLYYSARDSEAGATNGQGVTAYGTTWHVIDADQGRPVK